MIAPSYFTHSLFEEPWWLDLMAPDAWGECTVKQGDRILARMPYSRGKGRFRGRALQMPLFTMSLGPWLAASEAKYAKALGKQKDLMSELIAQLPPHEVFQQNFHHSVTNWLPFYWKGFKQTTAYTYVLQNLKDREFLWANLLDNIRTDVRKAEKQLTICTDLPVAELLRLNRLTFSRQGIESYYSDARLETLAVGLEKLGMGKVFYAVDAQGRAHAAVLIVWDERSAFYLVGGSDPELRSSGAMSFVLWEAIRAAAEVTREFNFHGSMLEPVERFFRAFGAIQTPYLRVSREVGLEKWATGMKGILR
ncbi:MAG: GNAT family N-acetyltransferase [Proteobacteria bacterium]|nr:MAG: GNAT family N-acetyltransferase [Pseudomonadota bacterium]